MSYLWWLAFWFAVFLWRNRDRTPKVPPKPPYIRPPSTGRPGWFKGRQFEHRGGHHNRYYPTRTWRPFWMRQ